MSEGFTPPQPSPEHRRVIESAGTWNVDCTLYMDPTSPMKSKAKDTVTPLGAFWVNSKFEGDMMGAPFQGRCQFGFDPRKSKYVSTWIDSMSPVLFVMEGTFDAEGRVLTLRGEGPDCMSGAMTEYRTEEVFQDPNHRTMSMFMKTPQGDVKTMEMVYRRA